MIRVGPTLTNRLAPGNEVYGYLWAISDTVGPLLNGRLMLKRWAVEHRLTLGTVCADAGIQAPVGRPGLRALHRLVSLHRPAGVVMPSLAHLSNFHGEVVGAAALLRQQGCLLFVVEPSAAIHDARPMHTVPWSR